jgi:putative phosphoribosyl transferase
MEREAPSIQRRFRDRADAGRVLAERLAHYAGRDDVLVLGLPRGGVPVAAEVARALGAPLDVFLVRKLGLPGQEELAMGAIASGGARVLNEELVETLGIPEELIDEVAAREHEELRRREVLYRGERLLPAVEGKIVIVVDDGLATGSSMRAAVAALRRLGPARIAVAVPTAPASSCDQLRPEVDELVCARTPQPFYAVGIWYENFDQVGEDEVRALLADAAGETAV